MESSWFKHILFKRVTSKQFNNTKKSVKQVILESGCPSVCPSVCHTFDWKMSFVWDNFLGPIIFMIEAERIKYPSRLR